MELPTWDACRHPVIAETASALERFIYNNEPGYGKDQEIFRLGLAALIAEIESNYIAEKEHDDNE